MAKKLTATQAALLEQCKKYTGPNTPIKFEVLKSLCIEECRTFENTFNALLFKGYFEHVKTDDFSNQFKMSS